MSRRWELWTVAVDSPGMMEFIGYGLFPEWSPVAGTGTDGRDKILFQRSRERGSRSFSVWTIDYTPGDTSAPTQVVSLPEAAAINPSWSPDGKWIVYAVVPSASQQMGGAVASSRGDRPIQADVWMTDTMGGARVNLTAGQFVNLMPTWGLTTGSTLFPTVTGRTTSGLWARQRRSLRSRVHLREMGVVRTAGLRLCL